MEEQEPLFLALETATEVMSAAVFRGTKLLGVQDYYLPQLHNRLVTECLRQLLLNIDLNIKEVQAVAVSAGPGSYTGLRVGASAAKGICMGLSIPLIAVSTLQGLAFSVNEWALQTDSLIIPMLDARRMEVYTAVYDASGNELVAPHPRILDEEPIQLLAENRTAILVGDGVAKTIPVYASDKNLILMPNVLPSARFFGTLIYQTWLEKRWVNIAEFEPLYLKEVMIRQGKKLL